MRNEQTNYCILQCLALQWSLNYMSVLLVYLEHSCFYEFTRNGQVGASLLQACCHRLFQTDEVCCKLSTGLLPVDCQNLLFISLMQVVPTPCSKSTNIRLQQFWFSQTWCNLVKPKNLMQLDGKLACSQVKFKSCIKCVGFLTAWN